LNRLVVNVAIRPALYGAEDMPNMSEKVAKRLLHHCLIDWKRHAVKFQDDNPGVAAEHIRKRIKWYMPLVHFSGRAYFDYFDNMDLAQLWDSMAACGRGEWVVTQLRNCVDVVTQLRNCVDCAECSVQDAVTYFDVAEGSTYGEVVAELAKDVERPYTNGEVLMDKSA
jgi:hypothetical protein